MAIGVISLFRRGSREPGYPIHETTVYWRLLGGMANALVSVSGRTLVIVIGITGFLLLAESVGEEIIAVALWEMVPSPLPGRI